MSIEKIKEIAEHAKQHPAHAPGIHTDIYGLLGDLADAVAEVIGTHAYIIEALAKAKPAAKPRARNIKRTGKARHK